MEVEWALEKGGRDGSEDGTDVVGGMEWVLEEGIEDRGEDGAEVVVGGAFEVDWEVGLKRRWRGKGEKPWRRASCRASLRVRPCWCLSTATSDSNL